HNHFFGIFGEVDGSLSSRVGAAYDVEGLSFAGERVRCSAAVVNTCALQTVDAGNVETAPLHTGGNQKRVTRNLTPVSELDVSVRSFEPDADGLLRREYFNSEALGLDHSATREIGAAQS